jgi:hypothetical protein
MDIIHKVHKLQQSFIPQVPLHDQANTKKLMVLAAEYQNTLNFIVKSANIAI